MALSWLTALKAVPWADVVQAAPEIVQGARKLFNAAKTYAGSQGNAATGAHQSRVGGHHTTHICPNFQALSFYSRSHNSRRIIRSPSA